MGRKFGRTSPPLARLPALQPAPRKALPPVIRAAVKLFDRQDGEGVDWRIMAEILFFAAFDALDRLPDDQRHLVAKRVEAGAYKRFSAADTHEFAANRTGAEGDAGGGKTSP